MCLVGSDVADLFENGAVVMAPCFYRKEHVHWAKERGGIVKNHFEDSTILGQCKKVGYNWFLPNGDEVVETATWYGLVTELDDTRPLSEAGNWNQYYFPLKHAGWKEHKAWKKLIERETSRFQGPGRHICRSRR